MSKVDNEELKLYKKCLGEAIQEYRKEKGLTQDQLAELAGLNRSTISNIERGKVDSTLFTILALADALKKTTEELFAFELSLKL